VYETLPGWRQDTSAIGRFELLPRAARDYVKAIEGAAGCEVGIISTSPQRERTIIRPKSRIAYWLPER
jgi:adenylosuccinate synthase